MSRRPHPWSEGRADSWSSPQLELSSDITSIPYGDYPGIVRFINKYPWIVDTQEIDKLLTRASVHETAGESSLAETCVHHALALRKWRGLDPHEARKYFETLAEGGETARKFRGGVNKELAALSQKRGHASTAKGITKSETPVFRERDERLYYADIPQSQAPATRARDERLYYTDNQGNLLQPASNRQNIDASRTTSDPATNDQNIYDYSRTQVTYNPEPSSRYRRESPNSISRRRPEGELEPPLMSYFLPEEGINYDVIQRDITRHLGATASFKPHIHKGRPGYLIKANKSPTGIVGDLKLASTKYENERRSSGGMRPPTSRQDSLGTFNDQYRYDTSDIESGAQQMRIRDDDTCYDLERGPSRPTAMSRYDQEQSRPRNMPDGNKATSYRWNAQVQISRDEEPWPVKAFLDTQADITCISEKFMNSLPGAANAKREPVNIELEDSHINVIYRSTVYVAWDGIGFGKLVKLVVYICSKIPGDVDLLISGDFIRQNELLRPGYRSVELCARNLEPGARVAIRQVFVRGPKLGPSQQDLVVDPGMASSAKPPQSPQPAQPPPRTTPGMRRPPPSHR